MKKHIIILLLFAFGCSKENEAIKSIETKSKTITYFESYEECIDGICRKADTVYRNQHEIWFFNDKPRVVYRMSSNDSVLVYDSNSSFYIDAEFSSLTNLDPLCEFTDDVHTDSDGGQTGTITSTLFYTGFDKYDMSSQFVGLKIKI